MASIATMARRAADNISTIATSDHGRAACNDPDNRELFDRLEFQEGPHRADYRAELEASAVCNDCPLRQRCGYRIHTPPSPRRTPRAR